MALALAAPLAVAAYSALETSIMQARNLLASLPYVALAVGALVARARPPLGAVAAAALLAGLAVVSVQAVGVDYRRPPFDLAAEQINRTVRSGDGVVQVDPLPVPYLRGRDPLLDSLRIYLDPRFDARRLTVADRAGWLALAGRRRVFVSVVQITGLTGTPPPPRLPGLRLARSRAWRGFAPVALFEYVPR